MFLGGYSSVTPYGRDTFPHKGRLIQYVLRHPKKPLNISMFSVLRKRKAYHESLPL